MKKVFIIFGLILLLVGNLNAGHFIQKLTPAGGEDACATNDLLLSWYMEDIDLANENGCSVLGDTTWSAVSAVSLSTADKSEGSKAVLADSVDGFDYYALIPSQNQRTAEGTIWFDFHFDTYADETRFFLYQKDSENMIRCRSSGISTNWNVLCRYEGNNIAYTVAAMTGFDAADNDWYRGKYQWKVNESAGDHKIEVWTLDSSTPREVASGPITGGPEDDVTEFVTDPDELYIGNVDGVEAKVYVDIFKLYYGSDL